MSQNRYQRIIQSQVRNRKNIRLRNYDYTKEGLYFITICASEKNKEIFGNIQGGVVYLNHAGETAKQCWEEIPCHFPNTVLHEYIIMPDHIHGIIELVGANNYSPNTQNTKNHNSHGATNNYPLEQTVEKYFAPTGTSKTIGSIVRGFKIGVTKHIGHSLWQRNYYEHIVRSTDDYIRISTYIVQNPQNWKIK